MSADLGPILLALARGAIARRFGLPDEAVPQHPALDEPGATFVTLTQDGELRGCIGSLEARRPLRLDVQENALAAAFGDWRFAALRPEEFGRTCIEVSLLTAPEFMEFRNEADALGQLRPGTDGVILSHDGRRATFLPQVWDSLPDPREFMAHLKRKAGLAPDFWSDRVRLARYRVTKWKDREAAWQA